MVRQPVCPKQHQDQRHHPACRRHKRHRRPESRHPGNGYRCNHRSNRLPRKHPHRRHPVVCRSHRTQPAGSSATAMSSQRWHWNGPGRGGLTTALCTPSSPAPTEVPANSQTCRAPSSVAGPAKTPATPTQVAPWAAGIRMTRQSRRDHGHSHNYTEPTRH